MENETNKPKIMDVSIIYPVDYSESDPSPVAQEIYIEYDDCSEKKEIVTGFTCQLDDYADDTVILSYASLNITVNVGISVENAIFLLGNLTDKYGFPVLAGKLDYCVNNVVINGVQQDLGNIE